MLGESNEKVVLCCNYVHQIAPWIRDIRKSTPEEDGNGIDVVVETTEYGDVPIQVKSSMKFVKEHTKKHPDIPVVVVFTEDSEDRVRRKIRSIVQQKLTKDGVPPHFLKGKCK